MVLGQVFSVDREGNCRNALALTYNNISAFEMIKSKILPNLKENTIFSEAISLKLIINNPFGGSIREMIGCTQ